VKDKVVFPLSVSLFCLHIHFYGVKVQLLTTKDGIPIAFHFTPGKQLIQKHWEK